MRHISSNGLCAKLFCALWGALLAMCCVTPAHAQTWTGNSNGLWNVGSNWSSNPTLPTSSIDTVLNFGAPGIGGTVLTQNIANPFLLNSLNFTNAAPGYTIAGSALDFRTSSTANIAQINFGTNNAVTLTTPLIINNSAAIFGAGGGTLFLNGAISGAGSLTLTTSATVSLGNGSNTYGGLTTITNGTLVLGNGNAIPAGHEVRVFGPGVFSTGGQSNSAATFLSAVTLSDGTFKISSGSGNYFINTLNQSGTSTVDFTGSTNATLHFTGSSPFVSSTGHASWIGAGTSRIVNDSIAPLTVNIPPLSSLDISARLANGSSGQGFRFAGGNGFPRLSNAGNSANFIVDDDAVLGVADMAFLGSGSLTLANTTGALFPGTLSFNGPSTTSSKPIALGTGGGGIWVQPTGTNLTLNGIISESTPGQRLVIQGDGTASAGATLTLTAANTYSGPTIIVNAGVLSVSSIPNGGVASPLGASSSSAANLVIGGSDGSGTLRYTGPTASTNRSVTLGLLGFGGSSIDVSDPATNLTTTGQLTGPGALIKAGPGTLTLANITNNYTGGTTVSAGRLVVGGPGGTLPTGGNVSIQAGAEVALAGFGNTLATAIGTLNLDGGTFRAPTGPGSFFLNRIESNGGNIDYSGSSTSLLRLNNAGAGVTIRANSTWIGNGAAAGSRLTNETAGSIDLNVSPNVTWTNGFSLFSGSFRLTGGGTLFQQGASNSANLVVEGARLRVDTPANLPTNSLTFNGGTLEFSGPSANSTRTITVGSEGIDINVSSLLSTLTLSGLLTGGGEVSKSGPGTLVLNSPANSFLGGFVVSNGRVEVPADNFLGVASPTVNAAGALRYMFTATTSRTFNLLGGVLEAAPGAILTLNGATVSGGVLRGPGSFNVQGSTILAGTTTNSSTVIQQTGPATLTNFTNNGQFFVQGGQFLLLNGATNTSAGSFSVAGQITAADFVSNGNLAIPAGGGINNGGSHLVLGAGSTTTLGTVALPGGQINLGGQSLDLRGGLLVNNGAISNGAVNVGFGGLAKGAGVYPTVNVNDGGKFSPGNSPGAVTTGSTTWGAGGGYLFEINDAAGTAGTNWDLWNINGGLSITAGTTTNSRFTISVASLDAANAPGNAANFNSANNYSWMIASTTTGITGFDTAKFTLDTSTFTNPVGGGTFALSQVGNNLFLNFNGVSTPPQWNVDANGSWSTAANWLPPSVPNGPAATASFLGKITAPRTVTLDGDKTVAAIYFDNPNAYTIAPGSGGTLTVVGGVDATGFNVQALTGNHVISAPLRIANSTGMTARPGASLTISGPFTIAAGQSLNGSGNITISGPQNHGANSLYNTEGGGLTTFASNAGAPATAATAAVHNLAISVGHNSSVTFTANQDISQLGIDTSEPPEHVDLASPAGPGATAFRAIHVYSANLALAKTSLYASIANANRAGAPDPTNGIFDSGRGLHPNSAIGLALVNDAHGDPNIFIRLTRIGDLNLDGLVTISDFIDLASHFNGSGTWQEGDLNYDGNITISDFIDLASNFNTSYSGEVFPISPQDQQTLSSFAAAHGASVPEPGIIAFVLLPILLTPRRRSRTA